jgi:hypothetical protein
VGPRDKMEETPYTEKRMNTPFSFGLSRKSFPRFAASVGYATLLLLAPPALRADEPAAAAGTVDGRAAYETLKKLAGEWQGTDGDSGGTRFRVTAGGHTVEEIMFPGTDYEMVNMYHLSGDELVVTHYCSSGNQPEMKLDTAASKPGDLVFAFAGGKKLDPARDNHIHGARLVIEGDKLREEWSSWNEGKDAGVMKFFLKRAGA